MWQGYALIEYESFEEAQAAIRAMNGTQLLTKTIFVDWAFSRGPVKNFMSTRYGVSHATVFLICSLSSFEPNRLSFRFCMALHNVNHVQNTCPNNAVPINCHVQIMKRSCYVVSAFEVPQLCKLEYGDSVLLKCGNHDCGFNLLISLLRLSQAATPKI